MFEVITEIEAGNMIDETGTMIGILIEVIETEIEVLIDLASMIREVGGHVLAPGIVPEIMTDIGTAIYVF